MNNELEFSWPHLPFRNAEKQTLTESKAGKDKSVEWRSVGCGVLILTAGIRWLIVGFQAHQIGAMIPPTGKHGWMTGAETMVVGAMLSILGMGWLLNEGVKARRENLSFKFNQLKAYAPMLSASVITVATIIYFISKEAEGFLILGLPILILEFGILYVVGQKIQKKLGLEGK